jgi:serine/threonine-protein kinase RsbW
MTMPSRRDAVAPTVRRILDAVGPAGLDHDQLGNFEIALVEALANAAVHGNRLDIDARVHITVGVAPGREAVVRITDSGSGFDHASVHDPTHPERVLATGGRGVFLMRRLVDQLEYNAAGNSVRLAVRRKAG